MAGCREARNLDIGIHGIMEIQIQTRGSWIIIDAAVAFADPG
jgi:hypothetical protein